MATLLDVKSYLSQRRRASLSDIAIGLATSQGDARQLIDIWVGKQRIRPIGADCKPASCKKSCCSVDEGSAMVYEWVDKEPAA